MTSGAYLSKLVMLQLLLMALLMQTTESKSSNQLIMEAAQKWANAHKSTEFGDGRIVQGDIILTAQQATAVNAAKSDRSKRRALKYTSYRWRNNMIPYRFDQQFEGTLGSGAEETMRRAMKHFEEKTCLSFSPYNPNIHGDNFVTFRPDTWCSSYLGMVGGEQFINMARACFRFGTAVHEIGHALGWFHEQSRPDRDSYVRIMLASASEQTKRQYAKQTYDVINTYGVAYDLDSIMHYPASQYMVAHDSSANRRLGQRESLSFRDAKLANLMYKCSERCLSTIKCRAPGYVGPNCVCVCENGPGTCDLNPQTTKAPTTVAPTTKPTPAITVRPTTASPTRRTTVKPPTPGACEWPVLRNKLVMGHSHYFLLRDLTLEQCKLACLEEKVTTCRSFHIGPISQASGKTNLCALSRYKAKPGDQKAPSSFSYWERPDCLLTPAQTSFCGWTVIPFHYLRGHNHRILRKVTVHKCRLACLEEQKFACRSFDFNARFGSCYLSKLQSSPQLPLRQTKSSLTYYQKRECVYREQGTRCPSDWTAFEDSCYRAFVDKVDWKTARDTCRRLGGYLMITTTGSNELVRLAQAKVILARQIYWLQTERPVHGSLGTQKTCFVGRVTIDRKIGWGYQKCHRKWMYICERNPLVDG